MKNLSRRTFIEVAGSAVLAGKLESKTSNKKDYESGPVTARVEESDTSQSQDCTFIDIKINNKEVNFILPLRYDLNEGDRIDFYDLKIKEGCGCWYITNRGGYSSLRIYRKRARNPGLILDGKEAYRREKTAYRDVLRAKRDALPKRHCKKKWKRGIIKK